MGEEGDKEVWWHSWSRRDTLESEGWQTQTHKGPLVGGSSDSNHTSFRRPTLVIGVLGLHITTPSHPFPRHLAERDLCTKAHQDASSEGFSGQQEGPQDPCLTRSIHHPPTLSWVLEGQGWDGGGQGVA